MNRVITVFPYRSIMSAFAKSALLLCLLFVSQNLLHGQSRKELEQRRQTLMNEIRQTDRLLKRTTQNREAAYDRYVTLQRQIERRKRLLETIQLEIQRADEDISQNESVIASLGDDLVQMKKEYGQLVRYAFRQKTLYNPLLYILSAANLNQAFRRWLFLRKYDEFRRRQAKAIAATQTMLSRKIEGIKSRKEEKENLLADMRGQQDQLSTDLGQKNKILKSLTNDESRLKRELKKKQKAHQALNKAIESIIAESIRESKKKTESAKKSTGSPKKSTKKASKKSTAKKSTPAKKVDTGLSSEFRNKRGALPWPVKGGFISRKFGRQKHPTISSVEITNNGIDIRTDEGAPVRAVYRGEVAGVQFIPGHDYTVIVQHGSYYTVYSNLSETNLNKGDQIAEGQLIGRVSVNPITNSSELHFEIWNEKARVNPTPWIRK